MNIQHVYLNTDIFIYTNISVHKLYTDINIQIHIHPHILNARVYIFIYSYTCNHSTYIDIYIQIPRELFSLRFENSSIILKKLKTKCLEFC